MRNIYLSLIILLVLPGLAIADGAAASTAPKSNFTYSGYIDGSYNYLVRNHQFTSGTFDRVYDLTQNGFTLQQAAMTFAYQPQQDFGALINPMIGRDAYSIAPYGWDPNYGGQWLGFTIPQAFLQYVRGPLTIVGGSLIVLAGEETVSPTTDTNFSRSILYGYAEPTTVLGLRGTYVFNDKINLIVGINNGWDNIRDTSRRKTLELSSTYTPSTLWSLAATLYSGGQRAKDMTATGSQSIRTMLDLIATLNATDKLTFIANYDYGIQPLATLPSGNIAEAVWQGLAGYVNYAFTDKWQTSVRGEVFSDRNGYRTGIVQSWKELTLTLRYLPLKSLEFRGETRHDFSNVSSFLNANSVGSNNNQQSYALEALYKFA